MTASAGLRTEPARFEVGKNALHAARDKMEIVQALKIGMWRTCGPRTHTECRAIDGAARSTKG